jgi:hypothetical protein
LPHFNFKNLDRASHVARGRHSVSTVPPTPVLFFSAGTLVDINAISYVLPGHSPQARRRPGDGI